MELFGGFTMRIKIPLDQLPGNFRVQFIEPCPTCGEPMIFGESDTGFNTITSGDICCYSFVQHIIAVMQNEGFLEDGPTNLDVIQATGSE